MRGRRGQIFIIAAAIISIVVIGMVVTKNVVELNRGQDRFYDYSEELKQEANNVIDYGIYHDSNKLAEFIKLSIANIEKKDPDIELFVVYGNETDLYFDNYATIDVNVTIGESETIVVPGANREVRTGEITVGGVPIQIYDPVKYHSPNWQVHGIGSEVKVLIDQNEYKFNLANSTQFYLVARKTIGGEEHVSIQ